MILRIKKKAGRWMALLAVAIALILMAACAPTLQTSASPSPTQDTEPLIPSASPSGTSGPFVSPNASPKAPAPSASPDKEANLYVLGAYISKTAYVDALIGKTMLPLQETLQALGMGYSISAADNSIEITKDGGGLAKMVQVSDFEYELIVFNEEKAFEGALRLNRKGSTLYAPADLFEFIGEVDATVNSYGDIFLKERPEASPSPGNEEPPDRV